jgi:hypothetical protein
VAAFTYDLSEGAWKERPHTYIFDVVYSVPEPGGRNIIGMMPLTVSSDAPVYDGYVLLGQGQQPMALTEYGGQEVDAINPAQPTRFLLKWDFWLLMTHDEAVAHFESITASVIWDGDTGGTGHLQRHELLQSDEVDWASYACTYTSP